jgi:hypothetical protein
MHYYVARHLSTKLLCYSISHTVALGLALEFSTESLKGRRFLTQAMLSIVVIPA